MRDTRPMRVVSFVCIAVGVLATVLPRDAAAQGSASADELFVGVLMSVGTGGGGLGVATSVRHYPDAQEWKSVSAFAQVQWYAEGGIRVAAGAQGTLSLVGGELGLAYRSGDADHVGTFGLHLAPFVSVDYLSLAWRLTIPLSNARTRWGTDSSFTFGANVPIPLSTTRFDRRFECLAGCLRPLGSS